MRHSSYSTTAHTYTHVMPTPARRQLRRLRPSFTGHRASSPAGVTVSADDRRYWLILSCGH
jgi:hypothetical protein